MSVKLTYFFWVIKVEKRDLKSLKMICNEKVEVNTKVPFRYLKITS